jgi:hypothetical protein
MRLRLFIILLILLLPLVVFGQGIIIIPPVSGGGGDVTLAGGQTISNKTIDADLNIITNIGASEIKPDIISGQTEDTTASAGEYFLYLNSAGQLRKMNVSNLPSATGETNLASNIGVGGVGVYVSKSSVTLQFKKVNAGSNRVSVTDDVANNEIDIDIVPANISILNLSGAPTSTVVGINSTQTLTNKTISTTNNTISGIGSSNIVPNIISGQTEDTTPDAGEYFLYLNSAGQLRKFNVSNLPSTGGGSGEINLAANIGISGVGVYVSKTGVTLNFKKVNAGSTKLSVTDDVANNEIDLDVVPANISILSLSGSPVGAVVGISDSQVLTNKTINADINSITNIGSTNVKPELISGQTEDTTATSGEYFLYLNSAGQLRKLNVSNLPAPTGEANLASNIGVGGVGTFVSKSGVTLQFKTINAGSNKLTVVNDGINNEVDIDVNPANIDILTLSGSPNSSVVGISSAQTLTTKTINADNNTITNIGSTSIKPEIISGQTEDTTPDAGEYFLYLNSAGQLRKFNVSNLPAPTGESNLGSNIGVSGIGVFVSKTGVTLNFKTINALSSKIILTDDVPNNKIDIDVDPSMIDIQTLFNAPTSIVVGISDTQTLINKTFDADNNTITNIGSTGIKADIVSGLTQEVSPASGDFLLGVESSGSLRKFDVGDILSAGGAGDITQVLGCTTGDCSNLVAVDGNLIDLSAVDISASNEGLVLPHPNDCSLGTGIGQICYDADSDILYLGTGSGVSAIAAGNITDIWSCTSGVCNLVTVSEGSGLDFSAVTPDSAGEGLILPAPTSCAGSIVEGQICWDSDDDTLYIGNGTNAVKAGDGDITSVFNCLSGDCSGIITVSEGSGLDFSAVTPDSAGEGLILPHPNDCTASVAEGQICWDADNDTLYVGSSATAIEIASGGSGDITDVFNCTSGDCSSIVASDGDFLDLSAINVSGITEGLTLPQNPGDCSSGIGQGQVCWDSTNHVFYVGNGTTAQAIGTGGTATLNDVFNNGKSITGANSQANGFCVGDGTDKICTYVGASGPTIECTAGGQPCDYKVDVASGKNFLLNLNGTTSLTVDSAGVSTLAGGMREVQTMYVYPSLMSVNGTGNGCYLVDDKVYGDTTVPWMITCGDDDTATIKFTVPSPKNWDTTYLTLESTWIEDSDVQVGSYRMDWAAYCSSSGDSIYGTETYGTEVSMAFTAPTAFYKILTVETGNITPAGSCLPGDMIMFRGQVNSSGTTVANAFLTHMLWARVNIKIKSWSNQ